MLIKLIDAVAHEKQRDVLCIDFGPSFNDDFEEALCRGYDYELDPKRQAFLTWLEKRPIA
jgi:hypothetical protein